MSLLKPASARDIRGRVANTHELGPAAVRGRTVLLRPPRFDDAEAWARVRIRDRALIEPFAPSSTLSWEQRHAPQIWRNTVLGFRRAQRAGRILPFVIEVDGVFAGQIALTWAEPNASTAEISIWLDSHAARGGVATVSAAILCDASFTILGMERITAATSTDNLPTIAGCERLGMHYEATMPSFFDAGGVRKTFVLYALTPDDTPASGFVAHLGGQSIPPTPKRRPRNGLVGRWVRPTPGSTGAWDPRNALAAVEQAARTAAFLASAAVAERLRRFARSRPITLGPRMTSVGAVTVRSRTVADREALQTIAPSAGHRTRASDRMLERVHLTRSDALEFTIELDGAAVGGIDLDQLYNRSARLRVAAGPSSGWTDIVDAAVDFVLDSPAACDMCRIWMPIEVGDAPLRLVAQRRGMQLEGVMARYERPDRKVADHELWAITSDPPR
ncbi:MAG TPA: GNAT family protein [Aldersonia sp.]